MGLNVRHGILAGVVGMACVLGAAGVQGEDAGAQTKPAAQAGVTLEDVKQHLTAFKEMLSKAKPATDDVGSRVRQRNEVARLFGLMNTVSDNLDAGQFDDALRELRNGVGMSETDEFREKLTALSAEVEKVSAVEKASYGEKVQALMKRVPVEMRGATKAEDLQKLLADLQGAQRRMNEGRMSPDMRLAWEQWRGSLDQAVQAVQQYSQMLSLEEDGDVEGALSVGNQLVNMNYAGRTVPGRDAILKQIDALEKKRYETTQKELEGMAAAVKSAKTSGDLTKVLDQLRGLSNRTTHRIVYSGNGMQRYMNEEMAVQMWGRVLDLESQKRYRTALNEVATWQQRTSADVRSSVLVPEAMVNAKGEELQKELLARADYVDPALKPLTEALDKAKSVEELEKAAAGINGMGENFGTGLMADADMQPVIGELQQAGREIKVLSDMERAIQAREWGRFWELDQSFHESGAMEMRGMEVQGNRWQGKIDGERLKLVREAIEQSAELKELKIELKADEPVDQALLEAADRAVKGEDYRRAVLVLRAYATFTYGPMPGYVGRAEGDALPGMVPAGIRADIHGLELFAQGKSFEEAGDLVSAVAAYRGVVRLTGERVPVKQATARLAAIGKSNPQLLERGDSGAATEGASPRGAGASPVRGASGE